MKGQPCCTALKCAFEPGAGTVLVERATSAASAGAMFIWVAILRVATGRSVVLLRRIPPHVSASAHSASRGFGSSVGHAVGTSNGTFRGAR
jgi:hypothetical protein